MRVNPTAECANEDLRRKTFEPSLKQNLATLARSESIRVDSDQSNPTEQQKNDKTRYNIDGLLPCARSWRAGGTGTGEAEEKAGTTIKGSTEAAIHCQAARSDEDPCAGSAQHLKTNAPDSQQCEYPQQQCVKAGVPQIDRGSVKQSAEPPF